MHLSYLYLLVILLFSQLWNENFPRNNFCTMHLHWPLSISCGNQYFVCNYLPLILKYKETIFAFKKQGWKCLFFKFFPRCWIWTFFLESSLSWSCFWHPEDKTRQARKRKEKDKKKKKENKSWKLPPPKHNIIDELTWT